MYDDVGLHQDLVIPVTNFLNEDKGFMVLAGDVFDVRIRKDIIHRVVRWQLAKRQQVQLDHYVEIPEPPVNGWYCLKIKNVVHYYLNLRLCIKNKVGSSSDFVYFVFAQLFIFGFPHHFI